MIVAAVNVILVALANLVAVTFADAAAEDTVVTVDMAAASEATAALEADVALVAAEAGFGFY